MLPPNYVAGIRQLQLFTLAQQLQKISDLKQELAELDQLNAEW